MLGLVRAWVNIMDFAISGCIRLEKLRHVTRVCYFLIKIYLNETQKLSLIVYDRDGEPIYYHGPHELWNIAGRR